MEGLAGGINAITRYYQMMQMAGLQAKLEKEAEERREEAERRAWSSGGEPIPGIEGRPSLSQRREVAGKRTTLGPIVSILETALPRRYGEIPEVPSPGLSLPGYKLSAARELEDIRTKASIAQQRAGYPFQRGMGMLPFEFRKEEKEEERGELFKQYRTQASRDLLAQLRPLRLRYQQAYGWTGGKSEALKEAKEMIELTREDIQTDAIMTQEQKNLILADLEELYARYFPPAQPAEPAPPATLPTDLRTFPGGEATPPPSWPSTYPPYMPKR